jgi:NADH-quinone oxidoreductase subunit C
LADEPAAQPVDEPTEEPAGAPNPDHDAMLATLRDRLGADSVVEHAAVFGDLVVRVVPERWLDVAGVAATDLGCDYLSFIAGLDWEPAPREGDEAGGDTSSPVQPTERTYGAAGSNGRFQVFAHVQSTERPRGLTLKTDVDEHAPRVASWVSVYPGADWHERECWEMFGIGFDGHPSLRHLYLPSEFEGHPLRKDFPLLARVVKPWPGLVDVEAMPGDGDETPAVEAGAGDSGGEEAT